MYPRQMVKAKIRQIETKTKEHTSPTPHRRTHQQNENSPKKTKYKSDLMSK